jgi:hypothetical protein
VVYRPVPVRTEYVLRFTIPDGAGTSHGNISESSLVTAAQ